MKYPIGIQEFDKIREGGYVYVDKTRQVFSLTHEGGVYFLGRPRRFGKSLLISTLENYYLGKKELFEGLDIYKLETEWKTYPVFRIDFGQGNYADSGNLDQVLNMYLSKWEKAYHVGNTADTTSYSLRLGNILEAAHQQTGQRAVVLIDEYDKPMLDVMDLDIKVERSGELITLEQYNREVLRGLYTTFKAADKHLQFLMLTGVTKFSQVSMFSGFNQPNDISCDAHYDALCGISKDELLSVFKEQIKELGEAHGMTGEETVEKLKRKYDGYHFSEGMLDVFNPFSLLNCLSKKQFRDYWFSTGTPTYLMRLLASNNENVNELAGKEYPAAEFVDYKATKQRPLPMLYQSGYLTIKGYDPTFDVYRLDFPNEEVRSGMISLLASDYFSDENYSNSWLVDVTRALRSGDLETFKLQLTAFLSNISYRFQRKQDARECERHFQYTFYLIMQLFGKYNTYVEKETSQGRIDCVLECPDYVYVFEFKLNSTAEVALKQIEDKGYALPYAADKRKVYKVGISFSSETGTLNDFDYLPR